MKEDFLHLVWQHQYLKRNETWTIDNEVLTVSKTGFRNGDSGPDFLQASLQIGDLDWIGSVEIHVRASEWNQHGHQHDPAYQSVILHVVWENDTPVFRADNTPVPTFELKNRVPLEILIRYRQLMEDTKPWIPCQPFLPQIEGFVWVSMQERVLVERLERKAHTILERFEGTGKNWLETFYQTLAWCLGLSKNSEAMLRLAEGVPVKLLASSSYRVEAILPMLLGVGGFLEEPGIGPKMDAFRTDFQHFQAKYSLEVLPVLWQRFRLRPTSFPVLRIVLFARILARLPAWFHQLTEAENPKDLFQGEILEEVSPWLKELLAEINLSGTGIELTEFVKNSLIINVFAPFLTAVSIHRGRPELIEKALDWLAGLKPEPNHISRNWATLKLAPNSAAESQAANELYSRYCQKKMCLHCAVGNQILGKY